MEDFLVKIWVTHEDVVYTQYPYKQCVCMLFLLMVHLYKNGLHFLKEQTQVTF